MSSKRKKRKRGFFEREVKRKAKEEVQLKYDEVMRNGTLEEMAEVVGIKLK